MSNKQSSVEWLMQKIALKYGAFQAITFYEEFQEEFKQAKAMHKEEIIKSFMNVSDDRDYRLQDVHLKEFAEQYYNQTFGGNK